MAMPVRALPTIQNWDCQSCSDCCRTYAVRVSSEERDRILKAGWMADPALGGLEPVVQDKARGEFRLNHTADGACVFLDENRHCRIHAKFGFAAKPLACRLYPFVLIPAQDHWRIGIRFACPTVAKNIGKPVTEQLDDLNEFAKLAEIDLGFSPADRAPPLLAPGQTTTWPNLIRFMRAFLDLLEQKNLPLELRLRQIAGLANVCRQSRFTTVDGPQLTEFLNLMTAVVQEEVPVDPATVSPPGWVGKMLFRQQMAIACRKDNGPDSGIAHRGKWTRIRAAYRFSRGRGLIPQLHARIPAVTFEEKEKPHGVSSATAEELLTRYYFIKIHSMQFCGPANFERAFWEGLDSLLLTYPMVMWLKRAFTTAERDADTALVLALRVIDDSYGFNVLLGSWRQTWATRTLGERGEVSKLIAWYSR